MSDGRKYNVGDKVDFNDTSGKTIKGIVHGVRYQTGRYELVGAVNEKADDPSSPVVAGTGTLELIKGTEHEHYSFEYIVVSEDEHKKWHEVNKNNEKHVKAKNHHLVKPLPELGQYVRIDT